MNILLVKANQNDCDEIHAMQIASFRALLEKYKDYETSPGAEPLDTIVRKMNQGNADYYLIKIESKNAGAIRVVKKSPEECRIAPMFILPEYQGNGYAKQTLKQIELLYPGAKCWELDTIKEESKLCYLYESMGYKPGGREQNIKDGMTFVYYRKQTEI